MDPQKNFFDLALLTTTDGVQFGAPPAGNHVPMVTRIMTRTRPPRRIMKPT